jgi:GxxExxY protein
MNENDLGNAIIGAALKIHSALGPGLLESVYEACLAHELTKQGIQVERQVPCAIVYDDMRIDGAFRSDLVVAGKVVVEVKAVERVVAVHSAQLLSYMKLSGYKLGYLLNFNVVHMKEGIRRMVNGL